MTIKVTEKVKQAIFQRWMRAKSNQRWQHLSSQVSQFDNLKDGSAPVIFFNSSTRIQAMSQNAAYSFLVSQALRFQGIPILQFACNAGMSRCVLGSDRDDVEQKPPCSQCVAQSRVIFKNIPTRWVDYKTDFELSEITSKMSLEELTGLTYQGAPLGFWAVNSLRWVLRRHHLQDDVPTRQFMAHFILSAWNILTQFEDLVKEVHPQAVVVFNGMFFPEAAVRYVAQKKDIWVITHEVGMRPYTAFFTQGEATAYPIHIKPDFQLTKMMDEKLDLYLSQRFKGNFSMAGIQFWPEIKGLPPTLLEKADRYKRIVPVFTNVIFDTSQVHANTIFPDMFVWLDNVKQAIEKHPETLFVIRAHPDEHREGKESRESVGDWVKKHQVDHLENVVFVDSREFISSYELIQRAHFVMVYNSTIGLEAALMGKIVLAGGKARFTQLNTAFLPDSLPAYNTLLEELLNTEKCSAPEEFLINARRFLYFQLYLTSLPFDDFLKEDGVWKGYVDLKDFPLDELSPEKSATMKTIMDGILSQGSFEYPL